MIKIFTTNKDGKIELTKEELKSLLDDSYWEGYRAHNHTYVYNTPSWTPYSWTAQGRSTTITTNAFNTLNANTNTTDPTNAISNDANKTVATFDLSIDANKTVTTNDFNTVNANEVR